MAGETLFVGSIGSASPELSREILDSSAILDDVMLRLQGYVKLKRPDGTEEIVKIGDRKYDDRVIAWMKGKLLECMNKSMELSNLPDDHTMYREARMMARGFWREMWINWSEFKLSPGQMTELLHLYCNLLSQSIRHPLGGGIRDFLSKTTSENTSRVQQTITESSEKKGGLFGVFKR